jgi:excisionase family DNA binding protein
MKDYFTVNELAEHFGVSAKTVYRKLWKGDIPGVFKVGAQWRISKKSIMWFKR